jgi:hypothetical protein
MHTTLTNTVAGYQFEVTLPNAEPISSSLMQEAQVEIARQLLTVTTSGEAFLYIRKILNIRRTELGSEEAVRQWETKGNASFAVWETLANRLRQFPAATNVLVRTLTQKAA